MGDQCQLTVTAADIIGTTSTSSDSTSDSISREPPSWSALERDVRLVLGQTPIDTLSVEGIRREFDQTTGTGTAGSVVNVLAILANHGLVVVNEDTYAPSDQGRTLLSNHATRLQAIVEKERRKNPTDEGSKSVSVSSIAMIQHQGAENSYTR